MTKGRALITESIHEVGLALLALRGGVDVRLGLSEAELCGVIPAYDALIVRSQTRVTAAVIEAATRLRVIGRAGTGTDNIDLEAASRRGIAIVNAPTANSVAAAEHTLGLLLAVARSIPRADASLRAGEWRRDAFVGVELMGKTLGIVGLGRVGREVARRARAFDMDVIAYDPHVDAAVAASLGVSLAPLEGLLSRADVVSLHAPLTEATRGLIGRRELRQMRPGAFLVNTARGGLVDEDALADALDAGHLGGAALDVFTGEPRPSERLTRHLKVVVTPHLGGSTVEAQARASMEVARAILAVLRGDPSAAATCR